MPGSEILYLWMVALAGAAVAYVAWHTHRLQARHARQVTALHLRTIEGLAMAIGAKDDTTHNHVRRVALYAESIGRELGLSRTELQALAAAALLHDIGKLAVPEHIISKPGRLTEEEFERMKIHTVVGAEILEHVQFPYPVAPIVRSHHERWNGTGYPDGLKGEAIPIGARILAVVDCFDALASDRQYRRAMPAAEAMAVIRGESGVCFDPQIVAILERLWPRLEADLRTSPAEEPHLSTRCKVDKGDAPRVGLAAACPDASPGFHSIKQARDELQVLYSLTQALGNSLSVDDTFQVLSRGLRKLIPFDAAAAYVAQDGELIPRFVDGLNPALLEGLRMRVGEGLSGWVAASGKCSLNGKPAVEPGYLHHPDKFRELRAALSVPLESSKGVLGVFTLYSIDTDGFTMEHLRILKTIAVKGGAAVHNALIYEETQQSAWTDALTGLPNARALFARLREEVARAARQHQPFTLFVIDVNGLKRINDTLGHLVGNRVIAAVAAALRGALREYDFAARLGGDEFVLLLPGLGSEDAAEKRIDLRLAVEALHDEAASDISVSMGSACYPADGTDGDQLLALADKRMYWHKRQRHRADVREPVLVSA
jgi:diguanylate cyclase (GGDEF)-like protein/putative nucleotidyltransferase with HDIG domain